MYNCFFAMIAHYNRSTFNFRRRCVFRLLFAYIIHWISLTLTTSRWSKCPVYIKRNYIVCDPEKNAIGNMWTPI